MDIISDGMVKITWMLTCASQSAPTATEANAGVSLEAYITPDGLSIATSTDEVDLTNLGSTQYKTAPGRRKDDISIVFKDQGEANAPWTTFANRPTGFLLLRRGVAVTTTWTAAQKVHLFPCQAGDRQQIPIAINEVLKFQVPFYVNGTIQESVALA